MPTPTRKTLLEEAISSAEEQPAAQCIQTLMKSAKRLSAGEQLTITEHASAQLDRVPEGGNRDALRENVHVLTASARIGLTSQADDAERSSHAEKAQKAISAIQNPDQRARLYTRLVQVLPAE